MNIHNHLVISNVPPESISRIFKKIVIDKQTGCWNWIGSLNHGYGEVRINNILYKVHRFMYAWMIAPTPKGKGKDIPVLDHVCNNRKCCKPAHLQLFSDTENILKGIGATARNAKKTHCHNGHSLPTFITGGKRRCMICRRFWNNRNYAKNPDFFKSKVRDRRLRLNKVV